MKFSTKDINSITVEDTRCVHINSDKSEEKYLKIRCNNIELAKYIHDKISNLLETIYPFKLIYEHREIKQNTYVRYIDNIRYDMVYISANFKESNEIHTISILVNPVNTAINESLLQSWVDAIISTMVLD